MFKPAAAPSPRPCRRRHRPGRSGPRSRRRHRRSPAPNLKAEVYEARLRLMSRAAGATHREEELCEGDIRGSFAGA